MSAPQSSAAPSASSHVPMSHLHIVGEACPLCEQPIPHDRFDEIKERIEAREQEYSAEITARLQVQFAREKTEALEQAQRQAAGVLERERAEAAARVASARDEGRLAAEAAANIALAATERANQEAQATLQSRIGQAEAAKLVAEQSSNDLRSQLEQLRRDNEAAIETIRRAAAANEFIIRAEAQQGAELAIQEKLANMESDRHQSEAALQGRIEQAEAAKTSAEEAGAALRDQLGQIRINNEAEIEKLKRDAATRESLVRQEAFTSAEATLQEKITGTEQARIATEAKLAVVEQQVHSLHTSHATQLAQRLQEQRQALEQATTEAVNAERSAAFEERLKWSTKVDELQRVIANKTAEELGEGAEIDLFEVLKEEFPDDRIDHTNRGQPGADILHVVVQNGRECGTIIYDSKNHNAWRNDFVTKLAVDQMAAKAEHAILSIRKFPAGKQHLHVQDGVILASPSRVVALVQIVRQHLVQTHTLRLSNEARTQKTAALYSFITSERCADLFARFDTHTDDLLEIQVKEKKAHDATWRRQGELLRSVQKVRAELCNEIGSIIGTADVVEQVSNE
jgi:hypothetical protein